MKPSLFQQNQHCNQHFGMVVVVAFTSAFALRFALSLAAHLKEILKPRAGPVAKEACVELFNLWMRRRVYIRRSFFSADTKCTNEPITVQCPGARAWRKISIAFPARTDPRIPLPPAQRMLTFSKCSCSFETVILQIICIDRQDKCSLSHNNYKYLRQNVSLTVPTSVLSISYSYGTLYFSAQYNVFACTLHPPRPLHRVRPLNKGNG